ncbi:MAG TPA: TonB family protein [Bryobacteraceae bacterium]|nr:TonB family protein [Bryobacteraceae bacterium]
MWFAILMSAAAKSAVILAAGWIAGRILYKQSAAARHMVWTAALTALLVLPFLSAILPALPIPLGAPAAPELVFQQTATTAMDAGTQIAPAIPLKPGGRRAAWHPAWSAWLLLLWAAGAAMTLARITLAYSAAAHLRRTAAPSGEHALCTAMARSLGIRHAVEVLAVKPGSMPMAIGALRPAILMPADAGGWSEERRRVVLLHELAHIRRGDPCTNLLAHIAAALYWWNPLAWLATREFVKEAERAADDLVLNSGARASAYAGHLLEIARSLQGSPAIAWAAVGMARRSQLERRLSAILDRGVNRNTPSRVAIVAAAVLAIAAIVPLAALRGQQPTAQAVATDIDAAISAARSQKNYESLDTAARAATLLGQYETAQKLLETALAIRAQKSGEQSVEYGLGLIKLAEAQQRRDPKAGADLYARAARILGDRPEAARALTHLGVAAIGQHNYEQAFDDFERARQADPTHAGTSLMWMASARRAAHQMDEAERLYQMALSVQDPKSADAAVIMRVYAHFLRLQGHADRAGEFDNQAAEVARATAQPVPPLLPGVSRAGGSVTHPVPLLRPEPQYSDEARAALLEGTVVLRVVIGIDGKPQEALIVRSLGLGLDEMALEAVNQWRFKPGAKDGQPVPVAATIEVNFRLL